MQGRKIVSIDSINNSKSEIIEPLKKELDFQTERLLRRKALGTPFNGEVTLMGDKSIPYALLKKIMVTCTKANYGKISLAVVKKIEAEG